ncbi:MAG: phage major capsid protein [Thermodesulfobacteriota bacterium]
MTKLANINYRGIGLNNAEAKKYSFCRAILAQIEPLKYRDAAGFELECSAAAAKQAGISPRGLMVPNDVLFARDLSVGVTTAGGHLVANNLLSGSFIDVLRNQSVVMGMGATILSDLTGNVAIPRKTSGSAATWIVSEGGDAAQSEPAFDQVTLTPKSLGAYSIATRQLLIQASFDVENMIRNDLAEGIAAAIDLAALYGSGTSGQPTGIANTAGINTPTFFAAAVPTWPEIVAMETAVAVDNNTLLSNSGYLVEPSMRGSLRTTEKFSGSGVMVWDEGPKNQNSLNGYKTGVTNQVSSGDVFFGNWQDLLVGLWGGLEILPNPYKHSLAGSIEILAMQSCDIALRHPESFAFNNDGV